MSLEASIVYEITNDSTLSGLIGTKIYSIKKVQKSTITGSYIVYRLLSSSGINDYPDQMRNISFNCYADTMTVARSIRLAVLNLFNYFSGDIGETGSKVTLKRSTIISSDIEIYDEVAFKNNAPIDIQFDFFRE